MRLLALARGEAGASPWRSWPLAAGLSLGVGSLIFMLGLASGVQQVLQERVAGTLPRGSAGRADGIDAHRYP